MNDKPSDMIRVSTHPEYKALVDRLLDLQGADGIVLSVQPNTKGKVIVGRDGQFKDIEEFRKYLQKSGLQFDAVEAQGRSYLMKMGILTAEFYQMDRALTPEYFQTARQ